MRSVGKLYEYSEKIAGCRFCPMCKPANEVANVTMIESDSTRSRAMMLWRHIRGLAKPGPREIQILFQSTLDGISKAWCVKHYPVSEYLLAARREMVVANLLPPSVLAACQRPIPQGFKTEGLTVFVAGEVAELEGDSPLNQTEIPVPMGVNGMEVAKVHTGFVQYALGDKDSARRHVQTLQDVVRSARTLIADGPQTFFALTAMLEDLGVTFPRGVRVAAIYDHLIELSSRLSPKFPGRRIFYHDSRIASEMAETLATDACIQPLFNGPEATLGAGAVFERARELLRLQGYEVVSNRWSRSLSRSCGGDDGLWLTYPTMAHKLASRVLENVSATGCDMVVTDSPLCAHMLRRAATDSDSLIQVHWLPEVFESRVPSNGVIKE